MVSACLSPVLDTKVQYLVPSCVSVTAAAAAAAAAAQLLQQRRRQRQQPEQFLLYLLGHDTPPSFYSLAFTRATSVLCVRVHACATMPAPASGVYRCDKQLVYECCSFNGRMGLPEFDTCCGVFSKGHRPP